MVVALINPYISAKYLFEFFKQEAVKTIAIFTPMDQGDNNYFSVDENWFDQQIYMDNADSKEIIDILKKFNPDYIINGVESSAHLTDQIAAALTPDLANDPETSHLRSNKFFFQDALKNAGLPYIQQMKVSLNALDEKLLNDIKFPCYCKPLRGVASVGAFKANDIQEIKSNFKKVLHDVKFFDASEYLIQEYIEGEEFFIDTFSFRGKHYVSSVQTYKREMIQNRWVYRFTSVVRDPEIWRKATDFIKSCLDATSFKNGFAHSEIFITPNNEMRLIEINPRISGGKGYANLVAKKLNLMTQPDLLIKSLQNKLVVESSVSQQHGYARALTLFHFSPEPLKDLTYQLKKFTSVVCYDLVKPTGWTQSSFKRDLTDVVMLVLLYHQDLKILEEDTKAIFMLEQEGKLF